MRRPLLAILLLLALTLPAAAQDAPPTDNDNANFEVAPAPKKRVADWKFITITVLSFGAAVFDVEATQRSMKRCPNCTEVSAWMLGPRPSRGRMYATILPLKIAETYAAYRLKKKGARAWFMAPSVGGGVNALGGMHSLAIPTQPSAATPKTCPAGGAGCASSAGN